MWLITVIIVGAIAGYVAGLLWKGSGYGPLMNIGIGVAGSVIGRLVFRIFGIAPTNIIGSIIIAIGGALLLLFLVNKFKK
jgi:uncharacterized membrane protein YeaQ/YmgE (transglycosylase-associated protein family)